MSLGNHCFLRFPLFLVSFWSLTPREMPGGGAAATPAPLATSLMLLPLYFLSDLFIMMKFRHLFDRASGVSSFISSFIRNMATKDQQTIKVDPVVGNLPIKFFCLVH